MGGGVWFLIVYVCGCGCVECGCDLLFVLRVCAPASRWSARTQKEIGKRHTYTHTYIQIYIYTQIQTHTYIYTHTHTYTQTDRQTDRQTYIHYTHTYIYTSHTYIYIYTHSYTHIYTLPPTNLHLIGVHADQTGHLDLLLILHVEQPPPPLDRPLVYPVRGLVLNMRNMWALYGKCMLSW
jgi:hypothetical protein